MASSVSLSNHALPEIYVLFRSSLAGALNSQSSGLKLSVSPSGLRDEGRQSGLLVRPSALEANQSARDGAPGDKHFFALPTNGAILAHRAHNNHQPPWLKPMLR